jgi:hypothetical protein
VVRWGLFDDAFFAGGLNCSYWIVGRGLLQERDGPLAMSSSDVKKQFWAMRSRNPLEHLRPLAGASATFFNC